MEEKKPRLIIDFSEIQLYRIEKKMRPNIRQLLNQNFVVYDAEFGVGRNGEYAIVKTDKGEFITYSKVLIEQLRLFDEYKMEKGIDGMLVRLIQKNNYLTFVSPTEGDSNE
jgi:hypothetical protein